MHAISHELRTVEPAAARRRSRPAPAGSRVRPPLTTHEVDAVSARRAGSGQRRCACGGVVGPGGECASCRARREQAARATVPAGAVAASREGAVEEPEALIDGVAVTNALACYGGGASSVCNASTGNYDITANNNTCASQDCSQRHEERHVSDLGPCCRKLSAAIAAGGDRSALIGQYNTWLGATGARAWSECNCYGDSLTCVAELLTANNCGAQSSVACDELLDYQTDMTAQQTSWCGRAPGGLPSCPFP